MDNELSALLIINVCNSLSLQTDIRTVINTYKVALLLKTKSYLSFIIPLHFSFLLHHFVTVGIDLLFFKKIEFQIRLYIKKRRKKDFDVVL